MSKPRIVKVTYENTMPKESTLLFYRLIENLLLKSLPDDCLLKGVCLNSSFDEFSTFTQERTMENEKED